MTRRLILAGAVVAAAVLSPVTASAQQAASITAVGWWSQRPGAAELPEGGFEVALFPNGPASQAALRVDVPTVPLATAVLEMTESEQVLGDTARILACPSNDVTWKPANPGPWNEAPPANCDAASVALGRSSNGLWTGDITSLLRGGTNSVVLFPFTEVSEQQQSVTFQVVFSGARLSASVASDPTGGAGPTPAPTFEPPPSFAEPPVATGQLDPTPAPVPGAPIAQASPTPEVAEEPDVVGGGQEDAGEPKPWWRLLYGIPLSIAVGVGAVFVRRVVQQQGLAGG